MKLVASDVSCGYGKKTVCRNLNLIVEPGKTLCLLGANGSGKTTLLRTLLGLLPLQGGTIHFAEHDLAKLPRAHLARLVAYVPQAHAATFPYKAIDMVVMGRTAHLGPFAAPGRRDRDVARTALERLRIAELGEEDYTKLSGGQRQLVLIARALAQEAPVLVMDEPTASLDFGNQAAVLREIGRLAGEGLSIVLSTHAPDHAFAIADDVLLIDQGCEVAQGPPEKILTSQQLEAVYGVPVEVAQLASGRVVCAPALGIAVPTVSGARDASDGSNMQ